MFAAMDATTLPDLDQLDSKALKSLIPSQLAQLASRDAEIEHLKLLIAKLRRMDPVNLLLATGAEAPAGGETICRRRTEGCLLPFTVSSS